MSGLIQINGGQPQKPTKFTPIYVGRWSSGLCTNRSPLRDAKSSRQNEKFYGGSGDSLIAGLNTEITNRLTLARRPGNSVYGSNTYTNVDRFEEFRMFSSNAEQIKLMVDQANALYADFNGTKSLVWTKSAGAGQTYTQSVGDTLYFGNGADNKKWLQTLTTWSSLATWNGPTTPFMTTFIIDPNGNIQQLTGTVGSPVGGTPVSGVSQPTWSTTVPNSGNNFTGGVTTDGTALWTNRGLPTENWGIQPPTTAPTAAPGSSRPSWAANTVYSLPGVIIDSNGNLQQVTTAGLSGVSAPTWATSLAATTADGTAIWTVLQLAASLTWTASHTYPTGSFVVASAGGVNCLFEALGSTQPTISGAVTAQLWDAPHSGPVGAFIKGYPATGPLLTATGNSLSIDTGANIGAQPAKWNTISTAGAITGTTTPFPSKSQDYQVAFTCNLVVPVAGQYTFTIAHHDGMIWGAGNGATKVSGPSTDGFFHTGTAVSNYPIMGANNTAGSFTDTFVVNFPTVGTYPLEFDYDFWYHSGQTFEVKCNGQALVTGPITSGTVQPTWPAFSTSSAPAYASVSESAGNLVWSNLGPTTDFIWRSKVNFTLANTVIVDPASNTEAPFRAGLTATTRPTFATGVNALTNDNPNLIWINQGAAVAPPSGTMSTFNGGWQYAVALVNSLDDTVSNASNLSVATGNFIGASGVTLPPGSGLPTDLTKIDPQADYVAIFRTTDGESTPFLINGTTTNSSYTVPLSTYLISGYTDTTLDNALDNLLQAATQGENTPPAAGAINLTQHLNRIFYSIGNVVYWTTGPEAPIGNGLNGTSPLNFDGFPSLVKRIVPTAQGAIVFTVSDVFNITGKGTASDPIQAGQLILQGVGLLSYNALDVNGSIIGLYTTDKQFIVLDPSGGVTYAGFDIGDQLRKSNGLAGTAWNAASVYVTWHVEGEDQAWYVSDGQFGWFRLMPTPSPESGFTWSCFASITGGCKAVQSIEVLPGTHKLLLGPTGTGNILNRDLSSFTDNGTAYNAYSVIGSAVLAQAGQVALVNFITTDSVKIGNPLSIGVIIDEALPYYTGPFEELRNCVNDPPNSPASGSIAGLRFYMSELIDQEAVCRHMQIRVNFGFDSVENEILGLTLFGALQQEA